MSELKDSGIVTIIATVAFVFGVIGMLLSFIPLLGALGFYIGIPAAIIAGIGVGVAKARKSKQTFALVALTISLIRVLISGWQYFTIIHLGEKAEQQIEQLRNQPNRIVEQEKTEMNHFLLK